MGITIHYSFAREQSPETLMKLLEPIAVKLGFKIEERSWNKLIIHPHEDCELIELHWHKVKNIKPAYKDGKMTEEWSIDGARLQDMKELDSDDWFCGGFVKTQYAGAETHIKVAEFLRMVSAYCIQSVIHDEARFYEKGITEKSIEETKESFDESSKMIGNISGMLKDAFGKDNVICGGDLNDK